MKKRKRIVMVATSAFGMGIDKPDIRYILHYQTPGSLEQLPAGSGPRRARRQAARCILLYDRSDLEMQEQLLAPARRARSSSGRFGRALGAWAGEDRDANIEELALSAGVSQRAASSLVTVLVEAGICERVDGQRVHPLVPLETLVERVEGLRSRFEILRREDARRLRAVVEYTQEPVCRSVALRRYFGDDDPTPCGRCDLCRTHGVAAPTGARPGRGFEPRNRRQRERKPWPSRRAPAPDISSAGEGVATGAALPGPPADGDRRRRRRRRGRRPQPGTPRPMQDGRAAAPPPPPPPVAPIPLPPLDPAADDLAAELGAPGLPPDPTQPHVSAGEPRPHRRRRRRRRRRGPGGPRDASPTPGPAERDPQA